MIFKNLLPKHCSPNGGGSGRKEGRKEGREGGSELIIGKI